MTRASLLHLTLLFFMVASYATSQTRDRAKNDGRLSGRVFDGVLHVPIAGVSVTVVPLDAPNTLGRSDLTEQDGTYVIQGLTPGSSYNVTFTKENYVSDAFRVKVSASRDGLLLKQVASEDYWRTCGDILTREILTEQDLSGRWAQFSAIPIAVEGKVLVAKQLNSKLPRSIERPNSLNTYAAADAEKVRTFALSAKGASSSNLTPLLTRDIDPIIIEDIRNTSAQIKGNRFVSVRFADIKGIRAGEQRPDDGLYPRAHMLTDEPIREPVSTHEVSADVSSGEAPVINLDGSAANTISLGQTEAQVTAALGPPTTVVDLGPKHIYVYPILKITFKNGKVFDVQ